MIKSSAGKITGSNRSFFYSCLLVTAVFLFTRLQYFFYYPVLALSSDSASYVAAAFDILNLQTPVFDIRTPGYPFFLAAIWCFSKTVFASSAAQSLCTLIASIFFLWSINRVYKSFILLFAVSLCGYIASSYFLILETAVLTEGIFSSLLLINAGFIILALKENKTLWWILFSITIALLILVRPAALFLFAVVIFIIIYFIVNKYKLKFYISLLFPCFIILILLCSYNYMTLRKFTITPFGEANLMGVTVLFMQPSDKYSLIVNEAIKNTLDSIPRSDINFVKKSYGISRLYHTFNDNFYRQVNLTENIMKQDSTLKFVDIQPIIRQISIDAIKNNPLVYLKFFGVNLLFFFNNIKSKINYYDQLAAVYKRTVIDKKYTNEVESGRWRQISSDKSDNEKVNLFFAEEIEKQKNLGNIYINKDGNPELRKTPAMIVFNISEAVINFIFRNLIWVGIYFIALVRSSYIVIKSRFRNADVLIPFLFCLIYISKAILVSLVEVSLVRYSSTVEFSIYFSLPFLIMLLKKRPNEIPEL